MLYVYNSGFYNRYMVILNIYYTCCWWWWWGCIFIWILTKHSVTYYIVHLITVTFNLMCVVIPRWYSKVEVYFLEMIIIVHADVDNLCAK